MAAAAVKAAAICDGNGDRKRLWRAVGVRRRAAKWDRVQRQWQRAALPPLFLVAAGSRGGGEGRWQQSKKPAMICNWS